MATATLAPHDIPPATPPQGDMLYEVVDGQVVEKPPMGNRETEIASLLDQALGSFAKTQKLGKVLTEMLFRIDHATDLQRRPDVSFISDARWPHNRRVPNGSVWDMVPDLAIEVVSPTNLAQELVLKVREYFQAGVLQVWVIYPAVSQVYVYESPTAIRVLQPGDALDGGALLPGFRFPVASLFEDEPQDD